MPGKSKEGGGLEVGSAYKMKYQASHSAFPFKSPLKSWPFGKKARMKRKLKKWDESISNKKVSEATDEELMAHHEKTREYDDGGKG